MQTQLFLDKADSLIQFTKIQVLLRANMSDGATPECFWVAAGPGFSPDTNNESVCRGFQ